MSKNSKQQNDNLKLNVTKFKIFGFLELKPIKTTQNGIKQKTEKNALRMGQNLAQKSLKNPLKSIKIKIKT
jgi:hypothetical protein